jgi:hypothetical protein
MWLTASKWLRLAAGGVTVRSFRKLGLPCPILSGTTAIILIFWRRQVLTICQALKVKENKK